MRKRKVKFTESFAGLGDPDIKQLDEKYAKITANMERQKIPPRTIEGQLKELKIQDRYNVKPIGMPRDYSFKAGDEVFVPADLAEKWTDAGLCIYVEDKGKQEKEAA